jgi:hypothetical protein
MRKCILQTFLIFAAGYSAALFLPWWSVAGVAAMFSALLYAPNSFWSGFAGGGLLWIIRALSVSIPAKQNLPAQVADLLLLNNELWLYALTGLIGGLTGGLGAACGRAIGKMLR